MKLLFIVEKEIKLIDGHTFNSYLDFFEYEIDINKILELYQSYDSCYTKIEYDEIYEYFIEYCDEDKFYDLCKNAEIKKIYQLK